MKKFLSILFLFLSVVTISGCKNKNVITCTGSVEEDGNTYSIKVTAEVKDNKIKEAEAVMSFGDETTANTMCGMLALANGFSEEEQIDYKCDDKKITFSNYLQMLEKDEYTKDEFIKEAEENDLTCK